MSKDLLDQSQIRADSLSPRLFRLPDISRVRSSTGHLLCLLLNGDTMVHSIVLSSQTDQGMRSSSCYAKSLGPGHRPVGSCLVLASHSPRNPLSLAGLPHRHVDTCNIRYGVETLGCRQAYNNAASRIRISPRSMQGTAVHLDHLIVLGKFLERNCAICLAI
jgi:hypothetical protein